jgi:hypothetical protein
MRAAFVWLLLIMLPACSCNRQKVDPTLVQVKTPIVAALRTHRLPSPCQQRDLLERAKCWVSPVHAGCTYLEVGSPADVVAPAQVEPAPEMNPAPANQAVPPAQVRLGALSSGRLGPGRDVACSLPATGPRILLSSNVERVVELKVDDDGQRIMARLPSGVIVVYVDEGQVLARRTVKASSPGAAFDWRDVESFDALLPDLIAASTGAQHERLVARLVDHGGEPGLVTYLSTQPDERPEWDQRFTHLSDAGQAEVRRRLIDQLDGGAGPWEFLIARPRLQPPDFADRVASQALTLTSDDEGNQDWVWGELWRARHPRAPELACEALHRSFIADALMPWEGQGGGEGREQAHEGALAIIALQRSACPWVSALYENRPCSVALSCGTTDAPTGEELQTEVLCTPSDVDAGLKQWLATIELDAGPDDARDEAGGETGDEAAVDPDDAGIEEEPWDPHTRSSAIFYGALMAQSPRPVMTRRLRSGFPLTTPKGSRDLADFDPPCSDMLSSHGLSNLCNLPETVTSFEFLGCQVAIDDARHRVVLRRAPGH